MRRSIKLVSMLVVLVIVSDITEVTARPSCNVVTSLLSPCLSFIKGAASPTPECCSGAKNVSGQERSQQDRQSVCVCLKEALTGIGSYDPNRMPLVCQKCGISVSIPPIDAKTDCSSV